MGMLWWRSTPITIDLWLDKIEVHNTRPYGPNRWSTMILAPVHCIRHVSREQFSHHLMLSQSKVSIWAACQVKRCYHRHWSVFSIANISLSFETTCTTTWVSNLLSAVKLSFHEQISETADRYINVDGWRWHRLQLCEECDDRRSRLSVICWRLEELIRLWKLLHCLCTSSMFLYIYWTGEYC